MLGIRNYFKLILTNEDIFDKKPTKPGELVRHEYVNGRKVYIFVAKDIKTRISFAFAYDRLNSKIMQKTFREISRCNAIWDKRYTNRQWK